MLLGQRRIPRGVSGGRRFDLDQGLRADGIRIRWIQLKQKHSCGWVEWATATDRRFLHTSREKPFYGSWGWDSWCLHSPEADKMRRRRWRQREYGLGWRDGRSGGESAMGGAAGAGDAEAP